MSEALRGDFGSGAIAPPAELAPSPGTAVLTRAVATSPPLIARLPEEVCRPFWSVMIPIYNCSEAYLRETLQSVLCQDPGSETMQIEVIDNCSTTGDPEALVREIGAGRIDFHRQRENLGVVENFNTCIRRARGQWVHILHGDDAVRPGFYSRAQRGIAAHADVGAVLCRTIYMDEDSQWTGLAELEARAPGVLDGDFARRQLLDQRIQFVAFAVRRSTYEELGGFRSCLSHCIDWDMWKRVAVKKSIFYDPEPMACYRLHAAADSSRLMRTGENVIDERRSIEFSCADIAPEYAARIRRAARKAAGIRAVRRARQLWKNGQRATAWRQFVEAIRCSLAPAVMVRSVFFLVQTVIR